MKQNKKEKTLFDFNNLEEIYSFLNMSVCYFYENGIYVINKPDYCNFMKGTILELTVGIERILNATFMKGFDLSSANSEQLKTMFPNACEIFDIDKGDNKAKMGAFLNDVRNINAHSIPSLDDYKMFDDDFSRLSKQPTINKNINYLTEEGHLSIAGFIYIVINFIREQSLTRFMKSDKTISYILLDENNNIDCSTFVESVSKVNLETPIRISKGDTVASSVLGDFYNNVDCSSLDIVLGDNESTDFNVKGLINGNTIFIKEGSLTRVFYSEDYCLNVEDVDDFIYYSNQLPPFAFVDLLYKLGIKQFSNKTSVLIQEKWPLYSKLGYPKFYIDKNIDILLLDSNVSDYRVVSNTVSSSVMSLMMRLEKTLLMVFELKIDKRTYTRINSLLRRVSAPEEVVKSVTVLRNFAMHGYIFGESCYFLGEHYDYSLDFAITTLYHLLRFFKKTDKHAYEYTSKDVARMFINRVIALKTNNLIRDSLKYINDYPNITNQTDLHVKNEFISHSIYDFGVFAKLNHLAGQGTRLFSVEIDGQEDKLYLRHGEDDKETINNFCQKHGFRIEVISKDGVVEYIKLVSTNR